MRRLREENKYLKDALKLVRLCISWNVNLA